MCPFCYSLGSERKRGDVIELGTKVAAMDQFFTSGDNGLNTWSLSYANELHFLIKNIFNLFSASFTTDNILFFPPLLPQ